MDNEIKEYINSIKQVCESSRCWNIPEEEGEFFFELLKKNNIKSVLEYGTSLGYSTLWFAAAVEETGKVVTIESHRKRFAAASEHFKGFKYKNIIQIRAHLPQYISKIKEKFDFIFIDIVKQDYIECFRMSVEKLNSRGFIVADNISTHSEALKEYCKYAESRNDFKTEFNSVGNGILISQLLN